MKKFEVALTAMRADELIDIISNGDESKKRKKEAEERLKKSYPKKYKEWKYN